MKTISYKLKDLDQKEKKVTLKLGYVGENEHVQIRIDCSEIWKDYPAAVASLAVEPPEGEKYPAIVTRDGDVVCWTVKDSDVAHDGDGRIQLTFTEGSEIQKTVICRTKVDESIIGSGTVPDPIADFVAEANEALAELEAAEVHGPVIGEDGYWYTWSKDAGEYVKTDTKAQGEDGHTPVKGTDYWTQQDQADIVAAAALETVSAVIDDTAGDGDTNKTWSADKISETTGQLLTAIDGKPGVRTSEASNVDLDICDTNGNVLVRFKDGHIQTKEFNSVDVKNDLIRATEAESDFDISDVYGNVVGRFANGGMLTKQFDGRKYTTYSVSGLYTVGHSLTLTISRAFKKGDKIVLHIENGAAPWTSGGRVAYYADDVQITASTWRGAETYKEYIMPKDVSAIIAVLPTNAFYDNMNVSFEVSLLGDVPITPTVLTIKKDGSGDYTNLRACINAIGQKANDVLNPYRIEIYPGEYDVLDDYTEEELEDIFYGTTSINQYSQTSFVGPKLLNGVSLVGMGKPSDVVLTAWLDPEPTDDLSKRQRGQISTLNLQGTGSIENLTIIAQNMRYCVHDDFSAPLGKKCKRTVKNCIFRGYNIAYGPHTTYGAGMPQGGMDFEFINCDFGENAGVHTQPEIYDRPIIHLTNCKGQGFRIGDNETVDPITDYTIYKFDNCDFLWINHNMADSEAHVKVYGTGNIPTFYEFAPSLAYDTGEVVIVPSSALTVGTVVEWYVDNAHGIRFKAITSLSGFGGIVVFNDGDNAYIQTRGYVRTDRLGLSGFSSGDLVGISGTACAIVVSESDAFGRITYVDNSGEGYVKIERGL